MFNNRTSIFTAYAALVLVGFGGTALLSFTGKATDTNAVVAFIGFYGFFCTTGVFYVLGKQKSAIESLISHVNEVNESHLQNTGHVRDYIEDGLAELRRDTDKRFDGVWLSIDRVEDQMADAENRSICSKK